MVVAVAGPAGLERYGLAPVDVPAEVARVRVALGDAVVRVLEGPVTLARLAGALREAPDVLYLVCHGTLLPPRRVGRQGAWGRESQQAGAQDGWPGRGRRTSGWRGRTGGASGWRGRTWCAPSPACPGARPW